jgi:hypothetical protein
MEVISNKKYVLVVRFDSGGLKYNIVKRYQN